jgi:hypothetical protein
MIGRDQIALNHAVQGDLDAGVTLCRLENLLGAEAAQEVSDQHAARAIDEGVERERVLALVLHDVYRKTAAGTRIVVVEPEALDGVSELLPGLRQQTNHCRVREVFFVHGGISCTRCCIDQDFEAFSAGQ